jgi:hypothetical protein
MNKSTKGGRNSTSNDKPDRITKLLMDYSRWRRRRLLAESKLPMKLLILRTTYFSGCVLMDGVFLPWIIIGLNRTILSYVIFTAVLALAVFLEVRFYSWWRGAYRP